MKILFDGRLVTSKPSGVRDITLGLITGFKALESAGRLQLIVAGDKEDEAFDLVLPSLGYMHLGLPVTALRIGASRIVVPRQTVPLISPVPAVPVFMDIGFLRIPEMYSRHWVRDLTTKVAARSKNALAISEYTSRELAKRDSRDRSVRSPFKQFIGSLGPPTCLIDICCVLPRKNHIKTSRGSCKLGMVLTSALGAWLSAVVLESLARN